MYCWVFVVLAELASALPVQVNYSAFKVKLVSWNSVRERYHYWLGATTLRTFLYFNLPVSLGRWYYISK